MIKAPYSVGKLIEWKQESVIVPILITRIFPPYSVGKLIEWKRNGVAFFGIPIILPLPTL
jgi:hypothetical protein